MEVGGERCFGQAFLTRLCTQREQLSVLFLIALFLLFFVSNIIDLAIFLILCTQGKEFESSKFFFILFFLLPIGLEACVNQPHMDEFDGTGGAPKGTPKGNYHCLVSDAQVYSTSNPGVTLTDEEWSYCYSIEGECYGGTYEVDEDVENFNFDLCCEIQGYSENVIIRNADGDEVATLCRPPSIGGEDPQYLLCAHEENNAPYDRKKRSVDESRYLSRSKRGDGDITDLNYYVGFYCPEYLSNSCASETVIFFFNSKMSRFKLNNTTFRTLL